MRTLVRFVGGVAPRPRVLAAAGVLSVLPSVAAAHAGAPVQPHDLWRAWPFEPAVVLGIIAAGALYLRGVRALWRHARGRRGISRGRAMAYVAGLGCLALALLSPLDPLAEALFAAHMTQHLLLIMVAAPLLVVGEPLLGVLWALPLEARRAIGAWWRRRRTLVRVWRALSRPAIAWVLQVVVVWLWHLPTLYDAAVRRPAVHAVEHLSYLATAMLFWWVLADRRSRRRLGVGAGIVYLFAAALQSTLLGAGLSLAQRPLFTAHWGTTAAWGLTPLEDQQLAGLIMWVPASLVYLAALAPLGIRLLRAHPIVPPPAYPPVAPRSR